VSQVERVAAVDRFDDWRAANPRSSALFERARKVAPAGVHHNMRAARPFPLFFSRGHGPHKWDVDGHRFVDYGLGQGSLILGHEYPQVVEAVKTAYMPGVPGACHELEVEWAELVRELIPCAELVRFVSSGTEATRLARRLARAFTERDIVVRLEGHYNGWHDYGMVGYRLPYDRPGSAGVPRAADETVIALPVDPEARALAAALEAHRVAAVILEPSGASWGTVPLPPGFCEKVRDLTTSNGSLLVFDEVITGFRWSQGGAQERLGVVPDLASLGKIVSGGFPGGALVGREDILNMMIAVGRRPEDYVLHHGTFNGHPVSAAAGVATLREVRAAAPHHRADQNARRLRDAIQDKLAELSIAGFCYGEASVFHVFLNGTVLDHGSRRAPLTVEEASPDDLLGIPEPVIGAFQLELRRRGVDLFSYNGGMLSAVHNDATFEETLSAIDGALRSLRDQRLVLAA
jgi:glutamate-1-semialdehyde 2,1-aminomutase